MNDMKKDFPFFIKNPDLIYLDSACTTIKPKEVIDEEIRYYQEFGACGGRSSHKMGKKTSEKIDESRGKIAKFVNAEVEGTIFTRNTTEGLNLLINGLDYSKRRKIVTTNLEHHSVLLPLMRLRFEGKIDLEIIESKDGTIEEEKWKKAIDRQTKAVIIQSSSNITGITRNINSIAKIAHENGSLIAVDGAQGVPHSKSDVKKDQIDFLCFSAHKMLGPSGIGAICMKKEQVKELKQFIIGGGTVKTVSLEKYEMADDQSKFEAGIQDYGGIFGFAKACQYIEEIGFENIKMHEKRLSEEIFEVLKSNEAQILGNTEVQRSPVYSFNIKGARAHDLALMLDQQNIALRSGYFCAQPALEALGFKEGAVRVSAYVYNSVEEIRKFGEKLEKISSIY